MVQQQAGRELVDLLRLTNTMTGASEIGQPGGLEAAGTCTSSVDGSLGEPTAIGSAGTGGAHQNQQVVTRKVVTQLRMGR